MTKSLCFVLGTRPEIIKLAPLLRRCVQQAVPFTLVHTGQHYDPLLDSAFFDELSLPPVTLQLSAAAPTKEAFMEGVVPPLVASWQQRRPSCVIVQGDTNSAYAGAYAADQEGIPVAHVEAGLRSDDLTMPEEVNRIFIDGIAARLYTPTAAQAERVASEGIDRSRILVTGNTVADAVAEHLSTAESTPLPPAIEPLTHVPYAVITLHRPVLVDDPVRFAAVLAVIQSVLEEHDLRAVFPVHPRARKTIGALPAFPRIALVDPIGYFAMLRLMQHARLLLTDSGGLQEESVLLKVPCVTIRENTERPETLEAGGNRLVGFDPEALRRAAHDLLAAPPAWKPLYEVDRPSDVILADLLSRYV